MAKTAWKKKVHDNKGDIEWSGIRWTLLHACRSAEQTSHSTKPLPTPNSDGYLVEQNIKTWDLNGPRSVIIYNNLFQVLISQEQIPVQ